MPGTDRESAVIVRIPIPASLERVRRTHLGGTGSGIPPHVTLLYPFLAPERLDRGAREALRALAADVAPFEVTFTAIGRFPEALYLAPEPARPFVALTETITSTWPDHPPYGGGFDDVVPHLTLVADGTVETLELGPIARRLPFTRPVAALEVIVADADRHWRRHWRIPLGGGGARRRVRR